MIFNDPEITGVSRWVDHDDHLHIKLKRPPPMIVGESTTSPIANKVRKQVFVSSNQLRSLA